MSMSTPVFQLDQNWSEILRTFRCQTVITYRQKTCWRRLWSQGHMNTWPKPAYHRVCCWRCTVTMFYTKDWASWNFCYLLKALTDWLIKRLKCRNVIKKRCKQYNITIATLPHACLVLPAFHSIHIFSFVFFLRCRSPSALYLIPCECSMSMIQAMSVCNILRN